jgi:hypothetical protein
VGEPKLPTRDLLLMTSLTSLSADILYSLLSRLHVRRTVAHLVASLRSIAAVLIEHPTWGIASMDGRRLPIRSTFVSVGLWRLSVPNLARYPSRAYPSPSPTPSVASRLHLAVCPLED